MVVGLGLIGLCFGVMVLAALVTGGHNASITWLAACYVLMTLGELLLSPVGLSLVTKLAPRGIGATLMGIWFLTLGFWLGGLAGNLWTRMSHAVFFGGWAALSLLAAVNLAALLPTIKRLSAGAE
jgi:POT family proton-dependent oligopeptide transporter